MYKIESESTVKKEPRNTDSLTKNLSQIRPKHKKYRLVPPCRNTEQLINKSSIYRDNSKLRRNLGSKNYLSTCQDEENKVCLDIKTRNFTSNNE